MYYELKERKKKKEGSALACNLHDIMSLVNNSRDNGIFIFIFKLCLIEVIRSTSAKRDDALSCEEPSSGASPRPPEMARYGLHQGPEFGAPPRETRWHGNTFSGEGALLDLEVALEDLNTSIGLPTGRHVTFGIP